MKQRFTTSIAWFMLFAAGLTGCSSGGSSDDKSKNVYKDIIQEYAELTTAQQERRIASNFLWSDESLGTGWSISERTHRWAIGTESSLRFPADTENDYTLHLQCWAPGYTKKQQELDLFLNGEFVQQIRISQEEKSYSFELPNASLRHGDNTLSFKFAHTQKPCDFTESDDCRELALAFKTIEFEPRSQKTMANVEVADGRIVQPSGASFSCYAKLPEQTSLRMHLERKPKELNAVVTIRTDRAKKEEFRLEEEGEHHIDLAKFAGNIVEIAIQTELSSSKDDAGRLELKWSEIELHAQLQDEAEAQSVHSGDTALREALKDYNVIYIVLDAFHAKHASLYGYERQTTPFLDKLAEESIVFDQMYANAPYTLASTASLFTSRYSHEHGLVEEINRIHPIVPTLSELLSNEGVASGLYSDSGWLKESAWGLLRGFSQLYNQQPYNQSAQEALAALKDFYTSQADRRSFMYIHLIPPHGPYTPPEEFQVFMEPVPNAITPTSQNLARIDEGTLAMSEQQLEYIIAMYDANILFADSLTQQIFAFLEEQGILEKSITIVTSDHGEAFQQHGRMLHNSTVFDEMLHVPFLVRFPKSLKLSGRRIAEAVSLIDIAPTLADIFGITDLPEFSGQSLLPLMLGDDGFSPQAVYAESLYTAARSLRDGRYKFIHSPADGDMLFDMVADPQEQHNLLESLPVTTAFYRQTIAPYLRESSATQNVELNTLSEETLKNLEDLGYIK